MKRKRTPNEMQNITSFFAKKNPTSTSLPHPTQNEQTISPPQQSEQTISPPQESEQHSSPSNYSTQNSPQNEQGQCSPNAPIFGERLSEHEFANLPQDPGKRRKMSQFHKDDRDLVRRIYIQRKPCQPKDFIFPQTSIFGKNRRFCAKWFDTWTWLEYSVEKDAAIVSLVIYSRMKMHLEVMLLLVMVSNHGYRKRLEASIESIQWLLVVFCTV
ncbi:uncharacterized protein LOC110727430 [Chenopodium quinoa]|uniref:uncharacterized protein LOC110727430 n=1 Tax=Chenopodium quinoa TaxID=63459 RepID=UPI000B77B38E|nr:uncharacterized protein LOC110727430 [Chenopodium quinoa]